MLTIEEVKHVAMLARVGLKDEEVEKFRMDLSAVLDSFRKLQDADVSGIEASGLMPGKENETRDDVSREEQKTVRDGILANVPKREQDCIKVKAVF